MRTIEEELVESLRALYVAIARSPSASKARRLDSEVHLACRDAALALARHDRSLAPRVDQAGGFQGYSISSSRLIQWVQENQVDSRDISSDDPGKIASETPGQS
jgi:hypothetical protein